MNQGDPWGPSITYRVRQQGGLVLTPINVWSEGAVKDGRYEGPSRRWIVYRHPDRPLPLLFQVNGEESLPTA